MSFQDSMGNSLVISILGLKILQARLITGFMKVLMMKVSGNFQIQCGDGLDFMMDVMSILQTKLKQVGTMFQIVASMLNKIQDMENIHPNMYITITFTLRLMSNQDLKEVLKELAMDNFWKRVNLMMNPDGETI